MDELTELLLSDVKGFRMPSWRYQLMGDEIGPVSSPELREAAAQGKVQPDTLVTGDNGTNWITADQIPGLFDRNGQSLAKRENCRKSSVESGSDISQLFSGFSSWIREVLSGRDQIGAIVMFVSVSLFLVVLLVEGGFEVTHSSSSSIPLEYNSDGRPNTSHERQDAVTEQMVRQGVPRADAEATTKAIYDAEREFQRND